MKRLKGETPKRGIGEIAVLFEEPKPVVTCIETSAGANRYCVNFRVTKIAVYTVRATPLCAEKHRRGENGGVSI